MLKYWMLVLAGLVLALAVGCAGLTAPQRLMGAAFCKAQCPLAKSLALSEGCSRIEVVICEDAADMDCVRKAQRAQVLYDTCVAEVDAAYAGCLVGCDAAFAEPEPDPEPTE
jgi:hypothetical protein